LQFHDNDGKSKIYSIPFIGGSFRYRHFGNYWTDLMEETEAISRTTRNPFGLLLEVVAG